MRKGGDGAGKSESVSESKGGGEKGVIEEDRRGFGRRGMDSSKGSWLDMRGWVGRVANVQLYKIKKIKKRWVFFTAKCHAR